jgi:hypothetical protein
VYCSADDTLMFNESKLRLLTEFEKNKYKLKELNIEFKNLRNLGKK